MFLNFLVQELERVGSSLRKMPIVKSFLTFGGSFGWILRESNGWTADGIASGSGPLAWGTTFARERAISSNRFSLLSMAQQILANAAENLVVGVLVTSGRQVHFDSNRQPEVSRLSG